MRKEIKKIISLILISMILTIIIPSNIKADNEEFLSKEELIVGIMKVVNGDQINKSEDISLDVRYKSYIEGAKLENIIDKDTKDIELKKEITREEAFYIIGKAFDIRSTNYFLYKDVEDRKEITGIYAKEITGILENYEEVVDNKFRPKDYITRTEFYNLISKIEK